MNPVQNVFARLVGRPAPENLPPVSKRTIATAESVRAAAAVAALGTPAQARPAPTPALLDKSRVPAAPAAPVAPAVREDESPAVTALRLEVQQLRLLRTPEGALSLANRLRESEAARAALDERLSGLQTANESLTAELSSANTRLRQAEDALALIELGPRP
ncbi:hypothetical protein PV413_23845 [Streptomyces scabiei]|uniref:hypothetical protein n=1 Tax=Streptomyces scabiei TaxID=1930 RepID=UPI0029AB7CEE|nr:hypothetical protein [Streptomyces scabiei]MDX2566054.1 hypothetical protein [Streptomyces scabiei]MDX3150462.1 hypothetical protein [Streptomyces scabiei]MDX3161917.1 hypothetical protein [Streptomyces scabiei]MDX3288094.1 hypothetical protein [Streptomyces scabiei]